MRVARTAGSKPAAGTPAPGAPKDRRAAAEPLRDLAWRKTQAVEVIARLSQDFPGAGIVLRFHSEWELLVSVILSAQCTDKVVNQVTTPLFQKYRLIEDYAGADPAEFEEDIRRTGFFRNKTQHIIASAQKILAEFGGQVPRSMAELVTLPGVARKTANIVLGNAYPDAYAADPDSGIAVDTHVHRLSNRLGLAQTKDAAKTEVQLMEVVPRADWFGLTYLLIEHGRAVCIAQRPKCGGCHLADVCPSAFRA